MRILGTIIKPIRLAWQEHKRRVNRPNMPCDFTEGVSRENLQEFATNAVGSIKGKKIEISVKEAVVKGLVQSNTGLSAWMFNIDFNDYGHITGKYWLESENDDSLVPETIAKRIKNLIEMQLEGDLSVDRTGAEELETL